MFKWFDKNEVNTGRQIEFDYMKGIFMVLIYLIHVFQGTLSKESIVASSAYIFNSMLGAAMFIFIMGFGTAYSRSGSPKNYCISGIKLIIYQYLNDFALVAALMLPYPFIRASLSEESESIMHMLVEIYIQYTNIFFISGIIYLIIALLKKLKTPLAIYILIGTAVSIAAPFVFGKPVDVPVLGYLVQLMIGDAPHVSFTPLYFLPYALFGMAIGKLYRHVKDKKQFYLMLTPVCAVIAIVWWVIFLSRVGINFDAIRKQSAEGYICPNLWHAIASIAHILLMAAVVYFIAGRGKTPKKEPGNPVSRQLLYYSKHISKFYAIHTVVYNFMFAVHGYQGFETWQCWILMIVCMVVTEAVVRGYNKVYDLIQNRRKVKENG